MITTELMTDPSRAPRLTRRSDGGWEGTRVFRVHTADVTRALIEGALPVWGSAWSAALPEVAARTFSGEYESGYPGRIENTTVEGGDGTTLVTVGYASPPTDFSGGGTQQAIPGQRFSVLEVGVEGAITRYERTRAELNYCPPAGSKPLLGGQGAPVEIGVADVIVHVDLPLSVRPDRALYTYMAAFQVTNRDPIVTPSFSLRDPGDTWLIAAGGARYRGFDIQEFPLAIRVRHRLAIRPDHLIKSAPENPDGTSACPPLVSVVYPPFDFGGLW